MLATLVTSTGVMASPAPQNPFGRNQVLTFGGIGMLSNLLITHEPGTCLNHQKVTHNVSSLPQPCKSSISDSWC